MTSIVTTFAAKAIGRIADNAVQMRGGLGVRLFRIYDGPVEFHRFAIAKRAVSAARRVTVLSGTGEFELAVIAYRAG